MKLPESETTFQIPIGPQHPALAESENFTFTVDGETVVDVKARLGYVHRGIEKALENGTYIQNLYLIERICGICSHAHTLCYSQNIDEALGIEAPPRARFIRTIVAELGRVHSHYLWLGLAGHEIGFDTLFMYTWRDREVVMDLQELITGNRVNFALFTIGGVRRDITPYAIEQVRKGVKTLEERIQYYKKMCAKEVTLLKRTVGVGVLKPSQAINLCAVGPLLRASGVKRDIRKDDPHAAYDEVPFNVITYDGCDVASRLFVRVDEVVESLNIIRYALEHLPDGPIRVKVPRRVPTHETISRVEAPRGELFHYVKSNGTDKPERYKVRTPTLANIPSVCEMLKGGYVADIPITLASIDPCFCCTDRVAIVDAVKGKKRVWTWEQLSRYSEKWHGRR